MKYFEFNEIIFALITAFLTGVFFGVFKDGFKALIENVASLKARISFAWKNKIKTILELIKNKEFKIKFKAEINKTFMSNIFDFIFWMLFFISGIIVSYAVLDGEIRVFLILIGLLGIFLVKNNISSFFLCIMIWIIGIYNVLFVSIMAIVFIPIKLCHSFFEKFIYAPIAKNMKKRRAKMILNEKIRELRYIFG